MNSNNQMIQKGKISSVEGKADRNGDKTTARVLPSTADSMVTRPLTIPWYLRGEMGNLTPGTEVAYAMFEDGTGIILSRMDGEWDGIVPGDITVKKGALTMQDKGISVPSADVTATGISLIPAALIASIVTLAYTWSGGILAVTLTAAVQYVIIVIGVTLCAYLAIDHLGGFDAMMSILYSNPRFETNMKPLANWSLVQFLGLFFSFLLGEFCAPYYIQRYASTKSAKDSKNGLLIFGVHWIFFMATTAAIGLASMAIQPDVKPDLAFTNLIRDILPPGITGLVFGALLAAVMSTGAAMINTSAVIYTRDIYNKFINTAATQAQLLRQSRLSTLVVGGISIGVAIIFQDVFGLMIYMFKLWPSAILPPLMCGLLWGKISPYAGAPAVIAGGLSFFLWSDKVLGEPFGIPANFIGIGMNCLVLFFVHQKMKGHKPEGPFLPDLN